MSALKSDVWERGDCVAEYMHEMSYRGYMFMVCLWTCVGIAASAVAAYYARDIDLASFGTWGMLGFSIGVLLVAICGTLISSASDNPAVSMLGYALVTIPFGVLLGPIVASYTAASVLNVFILTFVIVAVLGTVGALIPQNLAHWGRPLLAGLVMLIVALFGTTFLAAFGLPVSGLMTMLDWVGLFLFSALVVYDLNRAARLPRTQDNAIDSAVAIYLDFINIFIRLLSIMGQKK